MNELSKTGERRLADFERVIEEGLSTFVDVGRCLLAIRDEKLYRADHANFEDYLRGRWSLSRSRAYQLIDAAQVSESVSVDNEAQARALVPIKDDPGAMREVVEQAEADGDKTAGNLSKYVKKFKDAEGKGSESSDPVATGDSPLAAEGERPNSRVDHGAGMGVPAASAALTPDAIEMTCPHCGGSGRVSVVHGAKETAA